MSLKESFLCPSLLEHDSTARKLVKEMQHEHAIGRLFTFAVHVTDILLLQMIAALIEIGFATLPLIYLPQTASAMMIFSFFHER